MGKGGHDKPCWDSKVWSLLKDKEEVRTQGGSAVVRNAHTFNPSMVCFPLALPFVQYTNGKTIRKHRHQGPQLQDFSLPGVREYYKRRQEERAGAAFRGLKREGTILTCPTGTVLPRALTKRPPAMKEKERQHLSGPALFVINDIINKRLQQDLFWRLDTQRAIRRRLREGRVVLLRAPLLANDRSQEECHLGLRHLYMSCMDVCKDPAIPTPSFDIHAKEWELVMEPKQTP